LSIPPPEAPPQGPFRRPEYARTSGCIETEALRRFMDSMPDVRETLRQKTPMRRNRIADDIAAARGSSLPGFVVDHRQTARKRWRRPGWTFS
jgi:hypothetical protein